jgi:hypothetical protein
MDRLADCRLIVLSLAAAVSFAAGAGARAQTAPAPPAAAQPAAKAPPKPGQRVNTNARALAEVRSRIATYVGLRRELEATLPPLGKNATAEQIDKHERALAHLIQRARPGAKPGDIFTPAGRSVIRRLLEAVLRGPDGPALRASIRDENAGSLSIAVNARYPDAVPLATMPTKVLEGLPKLPRELEYRFLGDRLILLDVDPNLIVDLIDHAVRPQ